MKAKNWLLLSGLAVSGLVWNGCYTQIARPDQEEDTQVARESEPADEESGEAQRDREFDERDTDDRHVTNVYVYDDFRRGWRRPSWAYSSRYDYRYPRSGFYFSAGFGYYDPYDSWGWCGTPWNWCDPWDDYYSGYWGPYHGWRPSYYNDPFYYPRQVNRDRVVDQKKRTFTRRGATPADDNSGSGGTYATGGSRGSLARPVSGTYARGDDGSYRRVRRTEATNTKTTREAPNVIDRDNVNTNDSGRRTVRRTSGDSGEKTVARRPSNDGNSSGGSDRRGRKEPASNGGNTERRGSGDSSGGNVARPSGSGSSGKSSPPPSSGGSSGNSGSSDRRRRN